ncbi:MAG: hypothetical protein EAY75_00745 [Bacteroidetes bacterium]|nr:MAG: hypothetical protein EAY75_00745 [Bacteroidota bacterium]
MWVLFFFWRPRGEWACAAYPRLGALWIRLAGQRNGWRHRGDELALRLAAAGPGPRVWPPGWCYADFI